MNCIRDHKHLTANAALFLDKDCAKISLRTTQKGVVFGPKAFEEDNNCTGVLVLEWILSATLLLSL
ncbi:hypothetical protein GCM10027341_47080 [Spirosoma knui]